MEKKRSSRKGWIVMGLLVVAGVLVLANRGGDRAALPFAPMPAAAPPAALTPEQQAAAFAERLKQDKLKAANDAAWELAQSAALSIKRSAHDPSSVAFSEASYTDAGTVALEFRARNGFGALVRQVAVVTKDGKMTAGSLSQDRVVQAWNKHIAGKPLHSLPTP